MVMQRFITKQSGGRSRVIPISSSKPAHVHKSIIKELDHHQAILRKVRHRYSHFPLSAKDKREIKAALDNVKLTGLSKLYPLSNPYVRAYYSVALIDKYLKALKHYHKVRHKLDMVHDDIARASLMFQKEYIHSLDDRYLLHVH